MKEIKKEIRQMAKEMVKNEEPEYVIAWLYFHYQELPFEEIAQIVDEEREKYLKEVKEKAVNV